MRVTGDARSGCCAGVTPFRLPLARLFVANQDWRRLPLLVLPLAFALVVGQETTSRAQSFQGIPLLSGQTNATAAGVSGDGGVVVGGSFGSVNQAFKWTSSGGTVGLGFTTGFNNASGATAANSDGS